MAARVGLAVTRHLGLSVEKRSSLRTPTLLKAGAVCRPNEREEYA